MGAFLGVALLLHGLVAPAKPADEPAGASGLKAFSPAYLIENPEIFDAGKAEDFMGRAVALSGDVAVVGASGADVGTAVDQGAAYVFRRFGTTWIQQQRLLASDGAAGDIFGFSVAIDGDTIIVGARNAVVGGLDDRGAAYVFKLAGDHWQEQAKLTASDGGTLDYFGGSVAISGETVVVGAQNNDDGFPTSVGAAYVFVRSGNVWTQQQRLRASDGGEYDFFGVSVAISGDSLVVGAYQDDVGFRNDVGSAYVFVRAGSTWTQQQKLTPPDVFGVDGDWFGWAVGIEGDTAVVGAVRGDNGSNFEQGNVYVFVRSGSTWTQQQKLLASDGASSDGFGDSVDISGNTLIASAPTDDMNANQNIGAAYVFVRSGSVWTQQQRLQAADAMAFDIFGESVALDGNTAIAGANLDDVGANTNQGSAYVLTRSGSVWSQQQQLAAVERGANDEFGYAVASDGSTIAIGARKDERDTSADRGSVQIFERSGRSWVLRQRLVAPDGLGGDQFGESLALSGDTLVVGAMLDDGPSAVDQGSAYVFARAGGVWTFQQKLSASDGGADDEFGASVDVDGDTLVVGAPRDNFLDGSAYVFKRSGGVWTEVQRLEDPFGFGAYFGTAVSVSGTTIAVGAPSLNPGAVYVFVRPAAVWTLQANLRVNGAEYLGVSVDLRGNRLVTGTMLEDRGSDLRVGSAYAYTRSGTTWSSPQKIVPSDGLPYDFYGNAVALSANAMMVGSVAHDVGGVSKGAAYVYTLAGDTWSEFEQVSDATGQTLDDFARDVDFAGNLIVAGEPNAGTNSGRVLPFYFPALALTSSLNPAIANQAVTLTLAVTGAAPAGTVSFVRGGSPIASCQDVALTGSGDTRTASCTTTQFPVGTHAITVEYTGDSLHLRGHAALSQVIHAPAIELAPTSLPSAYAGVNYAQTVTASGTGATPPFSYTLASGSLPAGVNLVGNGSLSGVPTVAASYAFSISATDSSAPSVGGAFTGTRSYTLDVLLQPTTVTIGTIAPEPSVTGQAYNVPVSVTAPGGTPTGLVTVNDGSGQGCTLALSAGSGSCQVTSLSTGTKTITAAYAGGSYFDAGVGTKSHQVNDANQPPALNYSPSPGVDVTATGAGTTLGSTAQAQVGITVSGGLGTGSVTLGCNVTGGNFVLSGAPSGPIGVGASPSPISVQCTRTAAVQNGTLSCTETASPGGAQQGRSWPLVCPGADAVPPTLAYSPQPNNTITFPDGAVNATVASSIQVTSSGAVGNGSTTLSCTLGGTNAAAFQITGGNGQVVTGAQGGVPLQLGCTLGNTLRTATLDCTETYSTGGSSGRSWPLSCPPGIAVAGGTVTVGARNAVRGGKVAIPLSFRGEGSTRDFRAEVSFNKTQLTVLSVQGVGGATCSRRPVPNDDRIEVQRSTPGPLLAEDTRYCEVAFQVSSTAPGGALPLAVVASTCTDTGGTSRLCSRQDGRVAVAALDPAPADGAAIVIAAYEGTASQTRTLRIVNRGTNPQQVQGCTLLPATGLSVSQPAAFPLVIAPQTTGQVTVSCAMPPLNQPRQATLECTADDAMRSVMRYGVTCTTLAAGTPLPAEQVLDIEQRAGEQLASAAARGTDSGPLTKGASASSVVTFLGAPLGGSDGNGRVAVYADTGSVLAKTRGEWQAGGLRPIATLDARRGPQLKGVAPTNERFGQAVALHPEGSQLAVGAPGPVGGGQPGRVYLFDRPAGGWETFDSRTALPQELQAPPLPGGSTAEYGAALAYSEEGDLIVGAPGSFVGVSGVGALFVHVRNGTGFDPPLAVTSSGQGVGNGRFGTAVAANDEDLLVGAPGELSNGVRTGAAYRLTLQGGVLGAPIRVMPTASLAANDDYGRALHIAGDQWLIGSPGDDTVQGTDSGSVYVFRAGTNSTYLAQLLPAAGAAQGAGSALSSTSRHWFVGAPLADTTAPDAGRVYVFPRRGTYTATEAPSSQLENSGGRTGDGFGKALALGGGLVVIGVPQADLTLSDTQQLNDVGRADPFLLIELFGSGFE